MDRNEVISLLMEVFRSTQNNTVHLPEEDADIPVLEEPLIGFAAADDPLFREFKKPEAIGPEWMAPEEWLDGAKTVIAFFFPYTEEIRSRARKAKGLVNEAWKYGYPAGSALAKNLSLEMAEKLREKGIRVCLPLTDERFQRKQISLPDDEVHYMVSWSSRHAGYAAGLGTFGVHRHLITEKGCCGTMACSLIIDLELEPTPRTYTGIYDYCIQCGACARRCPADAITIEHLRSLKKCAGHAAYLRENFSGNCGKCMVAVPCEHRNPSEKRPFNKRGERGYEDH